MNVAGNAFVTGGASGIGKACCYAFAIEGAQGVIVADINIDAAKEVAKEIVAVATHPNFRAEAIHVDVSLEDSVKSAISQTVALFGRIDYCVHSAGVSARTSNPIATVDFTDFKRLLEVNVHGTLLVTSLVSAVMRDQEAKPVDSSNMRGITRGCIVNLASIASYITLPTMAPYSTSKHAVLAITKTAAIDNVEHGIRVNCVCPSWTDTPMIKGAMEFIPGLEKILVSSIPMGRMGRPEEVADTVLYLCSPRSSFTTGTGIIMDGGMSLTQKT